MSQFTNNITLIAVSQTTLVVVVLALPDPGRGKLVGIIEYIVLPFYLQPSLMSVWVLVNCI